MEEQEKTDVKVFLRLFPSETLISEHIKIAEDRKNVYVRNLQDLHKDRLNTHYWRFKTDGIFYNTSQDEIHRAVCNGLVEKVLKGSNSIIINYGQTCSGKTVTATGLDNNYSDRGIVPRIVEELYNFKQSAKNQCRVSISLNYVEMSKNYVRDLLQCNEKSYDIHGIKFIDTLKLKSFKDALRMLFKAEARKTFKEKQYYKSNMASSVITFTVCVKYFSTSLTTQGKLHIVDLCGADTEGNLSCAHKTGLEVGVGNLNKSQLEQFALVLCENDRYKMHAKQRLAIIIYYLRESLNTQSILRFVCHVRPFDADIRLTMSLLRFAQIIRGLPMIKSHKKSYREPDEEQRSLKQNIDKLQREKDLNSMIHNEDLSANMSEERYELIQNLAKEYLLGKSEEFVILNTSDVILMMKIFKDIYNDVDLERSTLKEQIRAQESVAEKSKEGSVASKTSRKHSSNSVSKDVKGRRSSTKKLSKESRKDIGSIPEERSVQSRLSKPGSKILRKKSSRRKSPESSSVLKSDVSMSAGLPAKPPEEVPTDAEAWEKFAADPESTYQDRQLEIDQIEAQLGELCAVYNEEVKTLKEFQNLVDVRKDEFSRAKLIRDVQRVPENSSHIFLTELEAKCLENLKEAETWMVQQEEAVLRMQSEIRILAGCKNNMKAELARRYEEYCKSKFSIVLPVTSTEAVVEAPSEHSIETEEIAADLGPEICSYDKNSLLYDELRQNMWREYEKRQQKLQANKKWVQSCKN